MAIGSEQEEEEQKKKEAKPIQQPPPLGVAEFLGQKSDICKDDVESKTLGLFYIEERKRRSIEETGLEDVKNPEKKSKETDDVVVENKDETTMEIEEPYGQIEKGRGAQEAKAIKKCDICLVGMHDLADCQFLYLRSEPRKKSEGAAKVIDEDLCEFCRSKEHSFYKCPQYAEYQISRAVVFSDDESKSPVFSESEDDDDDEVSTKRQCKVCWGDHIFCDWYFDVPPNAKLTPFYHIMCHECDSEMEKDLNCPRCKKLVGGYLLQKSCDDCGGRMSFDCCAKAEKENQRKLRKKEKLCSTSPEDII